MGDRLGLKYEKSAEAVVPTILRSKIVGKGRTYRKIGTARVQESCLPSGVSDCDYTTKVTMSQYRPSSQGSWGCPKVCLAQDYGKFSDKD